MTREPNIVAHVELPVRDIDRAVRFYGAVFGVTLSRVTVDGYPMAFFPQHEGDGASLALVQGDVYVPAKTGPIVYLRVASIAATIARARTLGVAVLYEPKAVSPGLTVAEIEDSEGNRIALHEVQAAH